MKILKISVLVMGFLIVGLTLVVIVTLANRWDETKPLAKQVDSSIVPLSLIGQRSGCRWGQRLFPQT